MDGKAASLSAGFAVGAGVGFAVGAAAAVAAHLLLKSSKSESKTAEKGEKGASEEFSMADQVARCAKQTAEGSVRRLHIERLFDGAAVRGRRVVVTGATRGLGRGIVEELARDGAHVIATARRADGSLDAVRKVAEENGGSLQVVAGFDVTDDGVAALVKAEVTAPVDIVINNAGYFKLERESILDGTMDFKDEVMTIDICAVGMLRVTNAFYAAGLLPKGSTVAFITSQGGSVGWRDEQSPEGDGHHLSKSAANMAGKLAAMELKAKGVSVAILHPGFVRTEMTSKYSDIWDEHGAVAAAVAAKRVLYQITETDMSNTGHFVNCEDGLCIPW